jgi:DNA-binding response OmpR family regulator
VTEEVVGPEAKSLKQPGLAVLSVSGLAEDHVALRHVLSHSNWLLHCARTQHEALECLRSAQVAVVICECDLPDGSWKSLLAEIESLDNCPVLVVSSRAADDYLWAEVLNLGGCDVLAKPFDAREVVWTVSMAWNDWNSRARRSQAILV